MKYLIVNADDFGASSGINRGISRAAAHGILTSASLMVNMPGTADAARSIKSLPDVSVGLHVNLTNEGGPPVVDLDNELACRAEIRRQFDCFRALAQALPTHLDAHHNVHRNPRFQVFFQELAEEHDLPLREHCQVRYYSEFYGQWDGETHPEQIDVASLSRMLRDVIREGWTELSCHPGYPSSDFTSTYHQEREMELSTLCDPAVRAVLEDCGIVLTNYKKFKSLSPVEHKKELWHG